MKLEELFDRANEAYDAGEFETAFKLFRQGAENGDTNAMISLAIMYTGGAGIPVCDYDEALRWEMKAFEAGEPLAAANIAASYRTMGNIDKAKKCFEKALRDGNDDAALDLAKLYMVSDKESENIQEYLEIAATSDNICEASREEAEALLKR